jgi:hypothetical protein
MSWISEDLEGGRRVARADGKLDLVGRALRCESFIEGAYRVHNVKNASDSSSAEFVAVVIKPAGFADRPSGSTRPSRTTATSDVWRRGLGPCTTSLGPRAERHRDLD